MVACMRPLALLLLSCGAMPLSVPLAICPKPQVCLAAGDDIKVCLDPTTETGLPAGRVGCSDEVACVTGYACFRMQANSITGDCLRLCRSDLVTPPPQAASGGGTGQSPPPVCQSFSCFCSGTCRAPGVTGYSVGGSACAASSSGARQIFASQQCTNGTLSASCQCTADCC